MVLTLKRWKSRTSPGIEAGVAQDKKPIHHVTKSRCRNPERRLFALAGPHSPKRYVGDAGWSSPVARQAHNLKVVGSNPTPATNAGNTFTGFGLRLHSFLSFMKCTTDKDKLSIA